MTKITTLILFTLAFAGQMIANEPLWTQKEREKRRDIVFQGKTESVTMLHTIDKYTVLYRAKVKVLRIDKGDAELKDKTLDIYFELSPSGEPGIRCPTFVKLSKNDSGKFFVRIGKAAWKKNLKLEKLPGDIFLLEMGSDVLLDKKTSNKPGLEQPAAPTTSP